MEDRNAIARVLLSHQRSDIGGCSCGWADWGKSWSMHVAENLRLTMAGHIVPPVIVTETHRKRPAITVGCDCTEYHDLVVDFGGPKPPITVLCGSTRLYDAFREQNLRLTVAGHIVLSIGCDTKPDGDLFVGIEDRELEELKVRLDELHKRKIDLADEVLVLNVGGYIGESTRSEIEYAEQLGKPIRYLEPMTA